MKREKQYNQKLEGLFCEYIFIFYAELGHYFKYLLHNNIDSILYNETQRISNLQFEREETLMTEHFEIIKLKNILIEYKEDIQYFNNHFNYKYKIDYNRLLEETNNIINEFEKELINYYNEIFN